MEKQNTVFDKYRVTFIPYWYSSTISTDSECVGMHKVYQCQLPTDKKWLH